MAHVLRSKFDVVMEVEGERYDVVQCGADFTLNQIPKAVCLMAIGREAKLGRDFAKIHYNMSKFALSRNTARLYFCPSGEWSSANAWPEGEHLIFEGRIVGTGLQKYDGAIQLQVTLLHWLGDLNFSSCMTEQSHPNNTSAYTFQATVAPALTATGGPMNTITQTAEGRSISAIAIETDLWGEAIKPLFCSLAEAAHVAFSPKLEPCGALAEQNNTQSLAALGRIEGETLTSETGKSCSLAYSCYTPKLAFTVPGAKTMPRQIAERIADAIGGQAVRSFEQQTIWGKLVGEFAPEFAFSVVPLVDRALVVPVVPGLRSTWCKRLFACDYNSIQFDAEVLRPIRAVAIAGPITLVSNPVNSNAEGGLEYEIGCGGCYSPTLADGEQPEGMILVQTMPAWLSEFSASNVSSGATIGVGSTFRPSAITPISDPASDDLNGLSGKVKPKEAMVSAGDVCNGYAHFKYICEMLRGRSAVVSGKLRFDIAPGSTVWVEGSAERFAADAGVDQLGQNLVGLVMRVSYGLNAAAGKAGTTFTFSHMRTELENADDRTSLECHPLYATRFLGAPLVDSLWFASEGDGCCSAGAEDSALTCA